MQVLLQKTESIELKIKKIGQKVATLEDEKKLLKEENLKLKKDLEHLRKTQQEMAQEFKNLEKGLKRSGDKSLEKAKVKKELDYYIKEVDKCIQSMENIA